MRFLGLHIEVNIMCFFFLVAGHLRLITDVLLFLSENNKEGDVDR